MRPSALLFDMDGTLTRPMLDFAAIKAEMGIGQRPILEAMAQLEPDSLRRAQAILQRHEDEAAAGSALNDGCHELIEWIQDHAMPMALITRNSRRSADTVCQRHGLNVDVMITRDEGVFKPSPEPLMLACKRLGVCPTTTWMIGDGQYDVEAGLAAGAKTVWLSHGRQRTFAAQPWCTVTDLHELLNVLRSQVSNS